MRVRFDSKHRLLEDLTDLREALVRLRRNTITRNSNSHLFNELNEFYNLSLYYATLAVHDKITYPFSLVKQERPDCRIYEGIDITGLEITKATESSYQKWLKETEALSEPENYNRRSYIGSIPEHDMATYILSSIEKKNRLLAEYKSRNPEMIAVDLLISAEHDCPLNGEALAALTREWLFSHRMENGFRNVSVVIADTGRVIYGLNNPRVVEILEIPQRVDIA